MTSIYYDDLDDNLTVSEQDDGESFTIVLPEQIDNVNHDIRTTSNSDSRSPLNIIVVGDLHVRDNKLDLFKRYAEFVEKQVKRLKPKFLVFLGDLLHYHGKDGEAATNFVWNFIETLSKITFVIVLIGNHDLCDATQFLSDKHMFNPLKQWTDRRVAIVDEVRKVSIGGYNFVFVPYVPDGRFKEALDTLDEWDYINSCDCIFAHQTFAGNRCTPGGDKWPKDGPQVISGHIHLPHKIGNNIHYVGSALQHNYGDFPTNRIVHVTFSSKYENGYKSKFLNTNIKKKLTIVRNIESKKELRDLEKILKRKSPHLESIRLVVTGSKVMLLDCNKIMKKIENVKLETEEKQLDVKPEADIHLGESFHEILSELVKRENWDTLTDVHSRMMETS